MTTRLSRRRLLGAAAGLGLSTLAGTSKGDTMATHADLILHNGQVTTFDPAMPEAQAIAISGERILRTGTDADVMALAMRDTTVVDLGGRRVIPGLNDSHTHLIRGGLNYNMELRWEGVPSLSDALAMLARQAERTPAPQWVRVVGGWSEFQFAEQRMPTLEEINRAAPDTPVFILHLYARALLNRAALEALGIDSDTRDPPGGVIERDGAGNATGMLIARPSALILYSTLARGPKLPIEDQVNSTRQFMAELNRLGITSVIDAGGGGQNYPDDYAVIERLHHDGQMTVRIAYNLFAQKAGQELADYERWVAMTEPGAGDNLLRLNGGGENLVWSAADFENFLEPRPDLAPVMESELEAVVALLAANRWPFRIHATYDETISRFLDVIERVNGTVPLDARFTIDHAETITPRNIDRIAALGGGIAIQHRMSFQGEYFVARYGARAAEATPPVQAMLAAGVPVGAGTDATRVASFNPWAALYWMTQGRTLGGLMLTPERNRLSRHEALRLWTQGSAWFSREEDEKGTLTQGRLADLAVLSQDFFAVPGQAIPDTESVLTVTAGRIVHATDAFADHAPPPLPVSPGWSPVILFGGAWRAADAGVSHGQAHAHVHGDGGACALHGHDRTIAWSRPLPVSDEGAFWGALGCSCFAF